MKRSKITENKIRRRVGDRSFARGKHYYEQGVIMSPWLQGDTLKAKCWGSMPQPYHIWVQLGQGGIESGECSCPIGSGGHCKHVAALLLTWLHDPDSFQKIEPLEKALGQREKSDLIQLIRQMIARYPDLEEIVHLPPVGSTTSTTSINSDLIRRQVKQAIKQADYGHAYYGAVAGIVSALESIMQQAEVYQEQGDWENTAVIYCTVLDELRTYHTKIYDHDGELGSVFWNGSERLSDCLEQTQQPETRLAILRTLAGIVLEDIEVGGYGFADAAYDILLEQAQSDEKEAIVALVEDELAKIGSFNDFSGKWQAEAYGRFLLALQSDTLDDDQFIQLCRRTSQLQKLVERLLQLDRINEAIADAKTASDYTLLSLADLFVTDGHDTIAEELVWERAGTSKDIRLDGWLKKQAANNGDWRKAIQHAERQFWQQPSVEYYEEMKTIAEKLGDWSERQDVIMSRLSQQKEYALLTRIQLLENNIEAALKTLSKVKYGGNLAIEVAKAGEETHPRESIRLYLRKAERLIAARGRGNYVEAAKYLNHVKNMYTKLQETETWKATILSIRNQKPRLPALLDELNKAGL